LETQDVDELLGFVEFVELGGFVGFLELIEMDRDRLR